MLGLRHGGECLTLRRQHFVHILGITFLARETLRNTCIGEILEHVVKPFKLLILLPLLALKSLEVMLVWNPNCT